MSSNAFALETLIFDYNDDHNQEFEIMGNRCISVVGWHPNYQPVTIIYWNAGTTLHSSVEYFDL